MTKFNTLIKFKDGSHMYHRDHIEAFENAISKGLSKPENVMYMYSQDNKDYFKDKITRKYTTYNQ